MNKLMRFILLAISPMLFVHCMASKQIKPAEVQAQSSVKIVLKTGEVKNGIVFKEQDRKLFYVDAASHKTDTLSISSIKRVSLLDSYLDFGGYEMSDKEIRSNKGLSKTLLYGGAGLILGAAVGTGASIALFAKNSNTTAARITIAATAVTGAALFGLKGAEVDYQDAVFKTRKLRYKKVKAEMDRKKAELERLKKEKAKR